ncbi:MAG: ThiF family adenylyltransferase [Phycisphaerales bacterium]|nr:ThiF family adenylyltransferase [Phycisphaerales bacterium]MCB9854309.1 ThiF family adenylyltransferase [Phycisphaerales bacterium]MCB9863510.1 ThiF family adenylyltransferase [Phycisphaerales bacterium]
MRTGSGNDRYARQVIFPKIGMEGQSRLKAGRVTLVGCGALGTVIANTLARSGVGFLRIIDRDYVEWNNLQRQVLFDESDAREGRPKAVAAAERLRTINSDIEIEPVIADVHVGNIETLAEGASLILDGTDNFETRYLINDVAVKHGISWVYGACVASEGMVMPIVPNRTPCLRCIFDAPPPAGTSPTCDTAGVIAPIVQIVAALQAAEAMKILVGAMDDVRPRLTQISAWDGEFSTFDMAPALDGGGCACCRDRQFVYLDGKATGRTAALCGRNAVQVRPASDTKLDLEALGDRVGSVSNGRVQVNRYLLRFDVDSYGITVFRDGRAIIKGASSPDEGKSVYAKYIGN